MAFLVLRSKRQSRLLHFLVACAIRFYDSDLPLLAAAAKELPFLALESISSCTCNTLCITLPVLMRLPSHVQTHPIQFYQIHFPRPDLLPQLNRLPQLLFTHVAQCRPSDHAIPLLCALPDGVVKDDAREAVV